MMHYCGLILTAIGLIKNVATCSFPATSAADEYPTVKSMGSSIDGASVDKFGNFYAVNKTHFLNLSSPTAQPLLVGSNIDTFDSSRFTKSLDFLVGDATIHTVWKASLQTPLFPANSSMLQPNDMAISRDESRLYLSGMNYRSDTGDLWYYNVMDDTLQKIQLSGTEPPFFRTNGIELSPDDGELFLSSAQNNPDGNVCAAQIFRFQIEEDTGVPYNPSVAIDLYATLAAKGLDPSGLDPDGMRIDVDGTLFICLDGFQAVLKWNTGSDPSSATVINLETVQSPKNLELGGPEGKDLFVIGQCGDGNTACIDHYVHDTPGKAFQNLQTA
jgi:gluconolactonase